MIALPQEEEYPTWPTGMAKGVGMAEYSSKRAEILRRVLAYINHDDWLEQEGFMVFGKDAFLQWSDPLPDEETDHKTDQALREFSTNSQVSRGKRALAKRIELGLLPEDSTIRDAIRMLRQLEPSIDDRTLVKAALSVGKTVVEPPTSSELDLIDAALATNLMTVLDHCIREIASYSTMPIRIPNSKVQRYFEEAHRCHLFGLDVGCAVLCRAILEAALSETIDPKGLRKPKRTTVGGSHLLNMIEAATGKFLTDDQAKAAKDIKDAGDTAIHDLSHFRSKYQRRMRELVDNTRSVLIALYS